MSFINELLNPRHSNITIKNCEFNDNIGPGIFASYCDKVNIFKNSIENHSYFAGIALVNTKNVKIIANNIKNNHIYGIALGYKTGEHSNHRQVALEGLFLTFRLFLIQYYKYPRRFFCLGRLQPDQ